MTEHEAEQALAAEVVAGVGGAGNVESVDHCVTRLRFVVRDRAAVDRQALAALPDVMSVVDRGGQLQIVIGAGVPSLHDAVLALLKAAWARDPESSRGTPGALGAAPGASSATGPASGDRPRPSRRRLIDRAFDLLTGTFHPLLYALVGSSMVKTALVLAVELGWLSTQSTTYAIWAAGANAAFFFLPILVGITASMKLGANPYVGGVLGAALLEAHYTDLGPVGTTARFLGIPVTVIDYSQSVIPTIIAAVMLAGLERRLKRIVPKSLHLVLVPTLCLAVLVPATVIIFGPLGTHVGEALSDAVGRVWDLSPAAAGALMGGFWQVFVIFGVHWGFVPVIVNDLAQQGHSLLTGPLVAAVLAQGAATLGVFVRTRNPGLRQLAGASSASAFIAGVTEPAIYGVTLRLRRPFVYACIGGAVGGAIAAVGRSAADSFIFPSLIALPAYLTVGSFPLQVLGTTTAVALAFGLTLVLGFRDPPTGEAEGASPEAVRAGEPATPAAKSGPTPPTGPSAASLAGPPSVAATGTRATTVVAPCDGDVVALAEVPDPVFAGGLLGPGVAIHPREGLLRAPITGRVTSLARGHHAIGITSADGVDVLIHVGMDTVQLGGRHFIPLVRQGDHVTAGDPVLAVDLAALAAAGYSVQSPLVVTNAGAHHGVEVAASGSVEAGDPVLVVHVSAVPPGPGAQERLSPSSP